MLTRALSLVRIDFAPQHRQPSWPRVLIASVAAIAGSLLADALLVVIGQAVFPSTRVPGVGWPVVTRVSSQPRWVLLRSAILVTLVLWLPDLYILHGGAPGDAVAVLMIMHVAIAVVTYNCLVRIAPVRASSAVWRGPATPAPQKPGRDASPRA
jgi:hypothetical protein